MENDKILFLSPEFQRSDEFSVVHLNSTKMNKVTLNQTIHPYIQMHARVILILTTQLKTLRFWLL